MYKTTAAGTKSIRVFNSDYGSSPLHLTDVNGALFFVTNGGYELWKSDGTTAGTNLIKAIPIVGDYTSLDNFSSAGGLLYFVKSDYDFVNYVVIGNKLWSSDGTEQGTGPVDDPLVNTLSNFTNLTTANEKLFFGAYGYKYGLELYVGDPASSSRYIKTTAFDDLIPMEQTKSFNAVLYPNPVLDNAALQLSGNIKNVTVTIADITGKILWQKTFNNQSRINLPVEKINPGSYLLTLKTETEGKTIKFVKQ